MRFGKLITFVILIAVMCSVFLDLKAQTVWSNTGEARYIKTTLDTVFIPGVTGAYRKGFVTNQTSSKQLYIYFSKADGTKDTASRVTLDGGKTLHFNFKGQRLFRVQASAVAADSVFSQVVIGDVQLNSIDTFDNEDFYTNVFETKDIEKVLMQFDSYSDKPYAFYMSDKPNGIFQQEYYWTNLM